jgi:hypothetical protein
MPEILVRLRVFDHSGPSRTDTWWQNCMSTAFLPTTDDDIQLWGSEDGPLAPVTRRWWRPSGLVVVEVVNLIVDSPSAGNPADDNGRLRWIPWHAAKGVPAQLLQEAGWEALGDA